MSCAWSAWPFGSIVAGSISWGPTIAVLRGVVSEMAKQKCAIHNTFYAETLPCMCLEHVIKKGVLVSGQFGRYDKHRQAAAITIFVRSFTR